MILRDLTIELDDGQAVSGVVLRPHAARSMLVLAHGAGAGMHHPFMESLAAALATRDIASLRYQFPYMEQRRPRPDPPPVLHATVRAAIAAATDDLPLFAGGKSMGGRMTSGTAAQSPLPGVRGIVFFGFPLHPAGRPGTGRAAHLRDVSAPMLFLQGTRDKLADLDLLGPVCDSLGARSTLHVVEGADHGFDVLKRSGRTAGAVLDELADQTALWIGRRGGV